jgi:hypothetical protein
MNLLGIWRLFYKTTIIRYSFFLFCFFLCTGAYAQESVVIPLPELRLYADVLEQGDADTYGLGHWKLDVQLRLEGTDLLLEARLIFQENARDYTIISGQTQQRIHVGALEKCQYCTLILEEEHGTVSGPNIGARGYRWYRGQALVRRAHIVTDTFGPDTGRIGGLVQLKPARVLVHCLYAGR